MDIQRGGIVEKTAELVYREQLFKESKKVLHLVMSLVRTATMHVWVTLLMASKWKCEGLML